MTDELKNPLAGQLAEAVKARNIEQARALLDQGADPNEKDTRGENCLTHAVLAKSRELIELLLDKGADIDGAGISGLAPIIALMYPLDKELMTLMLERGASLDRQQPGVMSPLVWLQSVTKFGLYMPGTGELLRSGPELRRQYLERKALQDASEERQRKLVGSHAAASAHQDLIRSTRAPSSVRKKPVI